jgi:hypothetical protein
MASATYFSHLFGSEAPTVGLAFAFVIFLTAFLADTFLRTMAFFFAAFGSAFFLRERLGVEAFLRDNLGVVTFFGVACGVFHNFPAFSIKTVRISRRLRARIVSFSEQLARNAM